MRILFFLLPVLLFAGASASAGWNLRHFGELSPQYRRLNQEGFAPNDSVFDAFGVLNSHAEWSHGSWFAEAKPEIRAVASRGVKNAPPDPNTVSVATSRRVLNTRRALIRDDDGEAYFDFDRLNVKYTFAQGEVFAGRKPLSAVRARMYN